MTNREGVSSSGTETASTSTTETASEVGESVPSTIIKTAESKKRYAGSDLTCPEIILIAIFFLQEEAICR
ncbi:unnamed protein product [Ceutorhynchus assimilis]|uniref:Uncharacterized protein n=1 Tax=Ceutorhynchus assimilis TaxID=467358 RepID=A0A9N9QR73_9CUCU|nr:unnamed protein product [Ceutorhynchus assimilis]